MTTVVYRDGVMAADSRAYCGRWHASLGDKRKIRRLQDGTLVAVSSAEVGADEVVYRWVADGCPAETDKTVKPDGFQVLVVRPNGAVFLAVDNLALSGPISGPYYAIGSGEAYALGALARGASAEEAVGVAALFDPHTGGEIVTARPGGSGPALQAVAA